MAESRTSLTRMLYLNGALAVGVLTVLVYLLLRWSSGPAGDAGPNREVWLGTLGFFAVTGLGAAWFFHWIANRLIGPLDSAELIATRVTAGNLVISDLPIDLASRNGGQIIAALGAMVSSLRSLTSAIQGAAAEAAPMEEQLAASTQEMTASTQEVAGTTGDLTERANQQALIVRAAAEDAGRILHITQELAAGATQPAERNAAQAR